MLYNKLAIDITILVDVNQREVSAPTPEPFDLALFGVTYTMSFCCS
jgi:hypothetical protein